MEKVLLCSHGADVDGIGCVVLGKLAFSSITCKLYENPEDLGIKFKKMLDSGELDCYDRIFVTDLSLYEPVIGMVNVSNIKDKILIFDHHQRAINAGLRKYPFITVIEEDETGKRCGTELFYRYLVNNGFLEDKKSIEVFVEYTRQEDTWDWKDNGEEGKKAHMLSTLFNVYGRDKYADMMCEKLKKNDLFYYDENESKLIKEKQEEYNIVLNSIISDMEIFIDKYNNKFGAVFSKYQYRNEIPEYIIENGNLSDIKYVIIVALDKGENGQKSYRRITNDIDCNMLASEYGGGGHVGSAAVKKKKKQREKADRMKKEESLKYLINSSYGEE